jgi:hypothetical protein
MVKMTPTRILILLAFLVSIVSSKPMPVNGVGTTLPLVLPSSPYRLFNDLMKQSTVFVPYEVSTSTWIPGRKWGGYNLSLGADLYPTALDTHIYAEAEITLFPGIDDGLVNSTFTVSFEGDGLIGVFQNGSFNITVSASETKNITVGSLNTVILFVYFTTPSNPVRHIQIQPSGATGTFSQNFLTYVQPFKVFRFCFW